ncbi:MAG: PaaI family thioesterase [Deltaproteobacteria bacterium]|nr:PaaI family thioesterase [Deltaproteobacteria bacterium]MBW2394129.1 PaaI family thioesterase [Deltaproteobacteria bacterium]
MSTGSGGPGDDVRKRFFKIRWEANQFPVSGVWKVRRRLADAMRAVIEKLITSDAPEKELEIAAERLEEYAERLASHPHRQRYLGFSEAAVADPDAENTPPDGGGHFDFSPLIGRSNPLAPPIEMTSDEDDTVHGTVNFGSAYEGPPGCVHGGYIAAAFDEVLGYAETFSGQPGMTGTLTTRYRTPTPLHTELRFEARVDRIEGRKIFVSGTLHAGDRLCAEADAIFISSHPGVFAKLLAERNARQP